MILLRKEEKPENGTRCIGQTFDPSFSSRLELVYKDLSSNLLQIMLQRLDTGPTAPPGNPIDIFRKVVQVGRSRPTKYSRGCTPGALFERDFKLRQDAVPLFSE